MMALKNTVSPRQPTPHITPMDSPRRNSIELASLVPSAYREPFSLGEVTAEKIDEVLKQLRHAPSADRIEKLERSVTSLKEDLGDIKHLIRGLADKVTPTNDLGTRSSVV